MKSLHIQVGIMGPDGYANVETTNKCSERVALDGEKLRLANAILSRPTSSWRERRDQIEEALRFEDDGYAVEALELEASIRYGSYREDR